MDAEHMGDGNDRENLKYLSKNSSYTHFAHQKSHKNWTGFESVTPRWKVGDYLRLGTALDFIFPHLK